MNEFKSYPSTTRFDPPEEGLMLGESIVWTRRAGTGFWVVFFGFIVVIGGPVLIFGGFEFGLLLSSFFLVLFVVALIALCAVLVQTRRTRYYLTNERIIEVRGVKVIREISLNHFAGKPIGQFLESRVTHRTNNRPIYTIRIYDPISDEIFEIKGQDYNSARTFERIGNVLECPYCHFDNTALASQCKNCGAVL
jgi:hypothetical protein